MFQVFGHSILCSRKDFCILKILEELFWALSWGLISAVAQIHLGSFLLHLLAPVLRFPCTVLSCSQRYRVPLCTMPTLFPVPSWEGKPFQHLAKLGAQRSRRPGEVRRKGQPNLHQWLIPGAHCVFKAIFNKYNILNFKVNNMLWIMSPLFELLQTRKDCVFTFVWEKNMLMAFFLHPPQKTIF